jgi:hypothetical protein
MTNFGTVLTIVDIDGSTHPVCRSGLLYVAGDKTCGVPLTLLHDAARIPDFGRSLKRPAAIRDRLTLGGYQSESRYDAAHGRRYILCAYKTAQERHIVLAAADGISNLRQHHIDCGGDIEALDRWTKEKGI